MRNYNYGIPYEFFLDLSALTSTIATTPCASGSYCGLEYDGCSHHTIMFEPLNYPVGTTGTNYNGTCIHCNLYGYPISTNFLLSFDFDINKINKGLQELLLNMTMSSINPKMHDAIPHANTYNQIPIYATVPDGMIFEDALEYFSDKFKIYIKDSIDGVIYKIWYRQDLESIYLEQETDLNSINLKYLYSNFLITDLNGTIFKITCKKKRLIAEDITSDLPQYIKIVDDHIIIPDYYNINYLQCITAYKLHYSNNNGFFVLPYEDVTDIRSYHHNDFNYEDNYSTNVYFQRMYFNDFYDEYVNRIFVNFNRHFQHGRFPLFKIFNNNVKLDNFHISKDLINQIEPIDIYFYVITDDFKIRAKVKIIDGIDIHIKQYSQDKVGDITNYLQITSGSLKFFNNDYIVGSDYADVVRLEVKDKTEVYYTIAPDNFTAEKMDFIQNYRYVSFDYSDSRELSVKQITESIDNKKPVLEIRNGIFLNNIVEIDDFTTVQVQRDLWFNLIDPGFSADPDFKTSANNVYQQGSVPFVTNRTDLTQLTVGFRTKCHMFYYYHIFFYDELNKEYTFKTYKTENEDFADYILAQLMQDDNVNLNVISYFLTNELIKYIIKEIQPICKDVEFIMWNGLYFNDPEKYKDYFGTNDYVIEFKYTDDISFYGIKDTRKAQQHNIYVKFYSEWIHGTHINTVLNHQQVFRYPESSGYSGLTNNVITYNTLVEPDLQHYHRKTMEFYKPYQLALHNDQHQHVGYDKYWAIGPFYTLKDQTSYLMFEPKMYSTVVCMRTPGIYRIKYPIQYKLWVTDKSFYQIENLNSSSSSEICKDYKLQESKFMMNLDKRNAEKINIFKSIKITYSNDVAYDETLALNSNLNDVTHGTVETLNMQSITSNVDGVIQNLWYVPVMFLNFNYKLIQDISMEYYSFYLDNSRYMPVRESIYSDDFNVEYFLSSLTHDNSNALSLEYLTNVAYIRYEHNDKSNLLITYHMQDSSYSKVYDKIKPDFDNGFMPIQEYLLYPNKFNNFSIAKE